MGNIRQTHDGSHYVPSCPARVAVPSWCRHANTIEDQVRGFGDQVILLPLANTYEHEEASYSLLTLQSFTLLHRLDYI